ncbi:MAG: hypothetical protein M1556_01300 [Candidatus Thermoplasmatota archaeon]|nr:hypothetical protein [Candidatus Thermoplasmatota archaeon]
MNSTDIFQENDELSIERQRETTLKAHADEYKRIRDNRDIWIGEIAKLLGIEIQLAQDLVLNKTLKEIEKDCETLIYYLGDERPKKVKERLLMDKTSHVVFWTSVSLVLVSVASVLFRLKVI